MTEKIMPVLQELDLTSPTEVEVLIRHDGKVVWINVDGICRFRASRIGRLTVQDNRPQSDK